MDYDDDDDIYGASPYDSSSNYLGTEEDLSEGFQIEEDFDDDDSEGAAWLAAQNETDIEGKDPAMGMATAGDLQLGRFSHMEPRIQNAAKQILQDTSDLELDKLDVLVAQDEFSKVIEGNVSTWASQLNVEGTRPSDVTNIDPVTGKALSTFTPKSLGSKQDISLVLGMLSNTAGEYLEKGAGSKLAGHTLNEEKAIESQEALKEAIGYIDELADLYIHPSTKESNIYGTRKKAVTEALTKRFMEGTFYEGAKSLLPLPNELGITGLVPTQSISGRKDKTSPYTRLQFSNVEGKLTEDEIKELRPSLANSIAPIDWNLKNPRKTQEYQVSQAYYKAEKARKVLREQFPTHRDESTGQIRMSGWDTPYGEQAEQANARNEAALLGIDYSPYAGSTELDTTEQQEFVQQATISAGKSKVSYYKPNAKTDREKYLNLVGGAPKQGTKEWLKQREGNITASKVDSLLKEGGVEGLAASLGEERLGTAKPFVGNAHTVEGNLGEEVALKSFMSKQGRNLIAEEAFFEQNEELPGFGVSPDARLFNKDGSSAGLLELKYLTSGSMKGALKKYTPQMQLQMAVTGESQTNFYALDKYTGEYVHEVVQADPQMQKEIIEAGQQARLMQEGLTPKEVQMLKMKSKSRTPKKGTSTAKGQTEAFVESVEEEDEITPFDAGASSVHGIYPEGGSSAASTLFAKAMAESAKKETKKDLADAMNLVDGTISPEQNKEAQQKQERAKARAQATYTPNALDSIDSKPTDHGYDEEIKDLAKASKEASESLKNFQNAVKSSIGVLAELGGIVTGGNKSAMDEVRFAAETGMDVDRVRGLRKELEVSGLSEAGVNKTINQAGNLVKAYNDEAVAASKFTEMVSARGKSNLEGIRSLELPSLASMKDMNPQEMVSMVYGLMEGKSAEERAQIGQMFGMSDLAVANTSTERLSGAVGDVNETGARQTHQGILSVTQLERETREAAGEAGYIAGAGGASADAVERVANSKTASMMRTYYESQVSGKKGKFNKALGAASALSLAPLAIAVAESSPIEIPKGLGAGKMEIGVYGPQDERSIRLFGKDFSKIIGSDVLPISDVLPSSDLNKAMPSGNNTTLNSNVEVNVKVDTPSNITTEVNDNGNVLIDQDNSADL